MQHPLQPKNHMFKRNLWKLTLSSAIVLWAAFSLYPLSDREFPI